MIADAGRGMGMFPQPRSALQDFHAFIGRELAKDGPVPSPEECVLLWRERCEVLAAVREGLADVEAGRTRPMEELLAELESMHIDRQQ